MRKFGCFENEKQARLIIAANKIKLLWGCCLLRMMPSMKGVGKTVGCTLGEMRADQAKWSDVGDWFVVFL